MNVYIINIKTNATQCYREVLDYYDVNGTMELILVAINIMKAYKINFF